MNISFIGGKKRARAYYQYFCERAGFKIMGFYCNPIKDCADIAISSNTCLFTCIDDLCNASDIIFICTEDEMLPHVINTMTKLHINNKIIISPARQIMPNDLDNGYNNTLIVFDSPVTLEHLNADEIPDANIVMCGQGKDYDKFLECAKNSGMSVFNITKPELKLFRAANHLLYHGINAVVTSASKLCKICSGVTVNPVPVIKNVLSNTNCDTDFYKMGYSTEIADIIDVLNNNGIESITNLVRAVGIVETENANLEKDVAYDMLKVLSTGTKGGFKI